MTPPTFSIIFNYTPHKVVVIDDNNNVIKEFVSEGQIRLSEQRTSRDIINGIPINEKSYGSSELPPIKEDTYYIVSSLIALSYPDRADFLVPDQIVRDDKGNIIGCRSLSFI